MAQIDVLGIGAVAIDELLYVESYPSPNTKTNVQHRERQCGGLAATALVAASRLGAHCAYAGTLGHDDLSNFAVLAMQKEAIDTSQVVFLDSARPVHSVIIVGDNGQTRNIFVDFDGVIGAHPVLPSESLIQSCKVLLVDHVGLPGMLRAAQIAHAANIPIVSDLEIDVAGLNELLEMVSHPIFSWEFAQHLTRTGTPAEAALKLWTVEREAVVITCGAEGSWFLSRENPAVPLHQAAFTVEVVDTTGCGDVFHGAYAAGLAKGMKIRESIEFASAAAAIKATRRGGQSGAPYLAAVKELIATPKSI